MRHNVSLKLATLLAIFISITACEKSNQNGVSKPEKGSNYFVYDGYYFDIKSVVSYDAGDNLLEFWLSSTEDLKTTAEVEAAGDYVVINTHKSYLGTRDRFSGSASDNSSIRFCNQSFKKGDIGNAYIEFTMDQKKITLDFVAENLYTRAAAPTSIMLKGNYSGAYVTEREEAYSNEWGLDRERKQISNAVYTIDEKGWDIISLYSEDGNGMHIQFDPSRINTKVTLPTQNDISDIIITYNNGKNFRLSNGIGFISLNSDSESIKVEINVKTDENRLRAYYSGEYKGVRCKLNRYIYDYEGDSTVEGWHDIVKLMVQNSGSSVKFYFSPTSGYTIGNSNSTHMPILTVPGSIINAGKTYVKDLEGWTLAYDLMQVSKFENEEKPHAGDEDWIEISKDGDNYTINLEITATSTTMPGSSLDIFYTGAASN